MLTTCLQWDTLYYNFFFVIYSTNDEFKSSNTSEELRKRTETAHSRKMPIIRQDEPRRFGSQLFWMTKMTYLLDMLTFFLGHFSNKHSRSAYLTKMQLKTLAINSV